MKNSIITLFVITALIFNANSQDLSALNASENKINKNTENFSLENNKGLLLDGYKVGMWISRDKEGNTTSIASYDKKGNKDGVWKSWDENGTLRVVTKYKNGMRVGTWKTWNENGVLTGEKSYSSSDFNLY